MQSKISDHNILINNNILFFNMMMQCGWNAEKKRFNNGFGRIETDAQYQNRIGIIVQVLAEVITLNPQISIIGLAEAPIKAEDIQYFIQEAKQYLSLRRFQNSMQPKSFTVMGVATLFDTKRYTINQTLRDDQQILPSLQHRLQEFVLTVKSNEKQIRLFNLHLPYDLAKSKNSTSLIRFVKMLFKSQEQIPVVVMGDFNINPSIIAETLHPISFYVQRPNNILIDTDSQNQICGFNLDTVDGILRTSILSGPESHNYVDASTLFWNNGDPRKEKQLLKILLFSTPKKLKAQQSKNDLLSDQDNCLTIVAKPSDREKL